MAVPGIVFYYRDDTPSWNELEIVADGTHLNARLNGVLLMDWDGDGVLNDDIHLKYNVGMKGHIALQIHKNDELRIRIKDIMIKSLNP